MPRSTEIDAKTLNLRFFAFGAKGVLFDNYAWNGRGADTMPRQRDHVDGQGISLLRAIGFHVAIITSSRGADAEAVMELEPRWNNLPSTTLPEPAKRWKPVKIYTHCWGPDKARALSEWVAAHGGTLEECSVMGNDIVDWPMMALAGFRAAPYDAEEVIKQHCDFITARSGGSGAVRDLVNLILEVHDIDPLILPTM
jgi:3-deoxy-D-manno-octulosonate 8-phosphate phosphatase (KDO 8-P phosphatase)